MIEVLGLSLPFVFVAFIIWLNIDEKKKRNQLQADLFVKALEKGQSIPSDLFNGLKKPKTSRNQLSIGIICIALGIGVALTFWLMCLVAGQGNDNAAIVFQLLSSVGVIPFLIGVAFVLIHFIEKKKVTNDHA